MKFNTVTFSMIFSFEERLNRTIRSSLRKKPPVFQQDEIFPYGPYGFDIYPSITHQNIRRGFLCTPLFQEHHNKPTLIKHLQENYHPCSQCHYYSSNRYLRCTINPISAENREICHEST